MQASLVYCWHANGRCTEAAPPAAQEDQRHKAIRLWREGKSVAEVARTFCVSRQAVHQWIKRYEQRGSAGLSARKRGKPPAPKLAAAQVATIRRRIVDRCPDQHKLPFALWTRAAVQHLIERDCGVKASIWTVGRYLKAWGFTPQKPARRALEQDPAAVARWRKEEYPAIQALAKREKAEILWEDEMGLRSDPVVGTSYSPRGRTPIRVTTGQRFGCNVISAISNLGKLFFRVFRGRFVTKVYLNFLNRLVRQAKRKVFVIADGHPVHKAKAVQRWLDANADRIRQFVLPPYSPELNPDEYLNQDVKSNAVGRQRATHADELVANVRGYLAGTQRSPRIVRNYFQAESVQYAAAME